MTLKKLDVWFHGRRAGVLTQEANAQLSFLYHPAYVAEGFPALSFSLPVQDGAYQGAVVKAFFSGLLPDDLERRKLAKYLHVSQDNPFSLLAEVGGECAGAVSLYPPGQYPAARASTPQVVSDAVLHDILNSLTDRPLLAGQKGVRLSLPGAQTKMAVILSDGQLFLPQGDLPTTHLIKPAPRDTLLSSMVFNEMFCMELARQTGFDVPPAWVQQVGDIPCFFIERYDRRRREDGSVVRLHQEDFCQAMGILPEFKYQREKGPSVKTSLDLIRRSSRTPARDVQKFLQRLVFNALIGNADAHGKNFALLYTGVKPVLAPCYDLVCTAVYPSLDDKMAMKIGGSYRWTEISVRHWLKIVPSTAPAQAEMLRTLKDQALRLPAAAAGVRDRLRAEGHSSPVLDPIVQVIEARSQRVLDQLGFSG